MTFALCQKVLVVISVCGTQGRTFLNSEHGTDERMNIATVRESLLADLRDVVIHGAGEEKLVRHEMILRPMYAALPKNEQGNLAGAGVSYALHRFFVEHHGWHVKGLEPGARQSGTSGTADILKDRVPGYMQTMVEQELGDRGFGLHELAVLAASLERLVHDDVIGRLQSVFEAHDLPLVSPVSETLVDQAIDTYMMVYIQGGNLTGMTPKRLQAKQARLSKKDPSWRETRIWMRDVRRSVSYVGRDRRNPFVSVGLDFHDAARVVEEIGEKFGRWQDLECRSLKNTLVELDHAGTGRVALSSFYRATLDGVVPKPFEFSETVGFLRQLGAVDETGQPSVLIPNYVNARTNCLTTSSFYSVCCIDECERLLGQLERDIGAPEATPARIAELVANLPSDTVEAPRNLSAPVLRRLSEVADRHQGRVPLHSRLFAQWLHHVYPRECAFPHASNAGPVSPEEWMEDSERHATPEEMREVVDASTRSESVSWPTEDGDDVEVLGELLWTEEQEFFAAPVPSDAGIFRQSCRCAVLAFVLGAVTLNLVRLLRESKMFIFPMCDKDVSKFV